MGMAVLAVVMVVVIRVPVPVVRVVAVGMSMPSVAVVVMDLRRLAPVRVSVVVVIHVPECIDLYRWVTRRSSRRFPSTARARALPPLGAECDAHASASTRYKSIDLVVRGVLHDPRDLGHTILVASPNDPTSEYPSPCQT